MRKKREKREKRNMSIRPNRDSSGPTPATLPLPFPLDRSSPLPIPYPLASYIATLALSRALRLALVLPSLSLLGDWTRRGDEEGWRRDGDGDPRRSCATAMGSCGDKLHDGELGGGGA